MPNKNQVDAQVDKLSNKILNKVYGITQEMNSLITSKDDVGINFSGTTNFQSTAGMGNISDIKIRDGRKLVDISDRMVEMMEAEGIKYVNSIQYNDRSRVIREANYMLTQMPQLYSTLSTMVDFIMSPDNFTEDNLIADIYISGDSAYTKTDIETILEEKGLNKYIKEAILGAESMGYRCVEITPLYEIANKLLKRVNTKTPVSATVSGVRVPAKPITASVSHKEIKDIVFYAEADKSEQVIIPGSFVRLYREAQDNLIEKKRMSDLIYDAIDESLGINEYATGAKKYAEAAILNPTTDNKNIALGSLFFNESHISLNNRNELALKMHNKLMGIEREVYYYSEAEKKEMAKTLYAEADTHQISNDEKEYRKALSELKKNYRSKKKTKIKDLTGCHINLLDDEKIYPVIVNKEWIGVYVIDTFTDVAMHKMQSTSVNNVLGSSKFQDTSDYRDNPLIRKDILDGLSKTILNHLDANFVTDNRRILGSILKVLEENDMFNCQFRVRFIPRKYIVPFNTADANNGIGKSKLLYARIPIIYWIYLEQDRMLTKLFYEKDKLAIKYRTTFAQSLYNDRNDAMEIFSELFPLPSELVDFSRVHSAMGSIGRLLIPTNKDGEGLFDIDRIEGQKYDNSNDDFMGKLEKTIENILGFPMSSLNQAEKSYDFATSIIAQDGRLTTLIKNMQIHYAPMATELATKMARYETGEDDSFVEITFPEPKLLNKSITNENYQKFDENINNILKTYYGEDETIPTEKKAFIKREIIKRLYPAFDNSDIIEEIELKWKSHKSTIISKKEDEE